MDINNEIRDDIKTLLVASAKHQTKLENVDERLKQLNGSVAKNTKEIVTIKSVIKYNKGVIFGAMGIISAFWAIISYLK